MPYYTTSLILLASLLSSSVQAASLNPYESKNGRLSGGAIAGIVIGTLDSAELNLLIVTSQRAL